MKTDTRMGTMWTEKETKYYYMNVFDPFGNRGNYDYFFYSKRTGNLIDKMFKASHEDALAHWEEYYAKSKW